MSLIHARRLLSICINQAIVFFVTASCSAVFDAECAAAQENHSRDGGFSGKSFSEVYSQLGIPVVFEVEADWQRLDYCGLNCVYAFVNIESGRRIAHGAVRRVAGGIPDGGLSLDAMQALALSFGVRSDIVRGDPLRLEVHDLPAIVHVGLANQPGHFMCLYQIDRDENRDYRYWLLDGTSGAVIIYNEVEFGELVRQSSGYMMLASRRESVTYYILVFILVATATNVVLWRRIIVALKSR